MAYGWTPNQVAELTLAQLALAIEEAPGIGYGDAVAHVQRARMLRRAGLGGLL